MAAPILTQKKFWIVKPKAGRNELWNPTFATPQGISFWAASGAGVTIELTGDYARWGARSMKVKTATGVVSSAYYNRGLKVTNGLKYTFSCDVKGVAGQPMRIVIATSTGTARATKTFTATGYWQRVEVTLLATESATNYRVQVTRDAVSSVSPFYVDGVQFEQESKATTFIHGYGDGCKWEGAIRSSASIRSAYTGLGGELLDLEDYCQLVQVTGLGHGDWNQILTKMTSGGDLYQDHIRKSRQFSIIVDFTGETLGEIEANRKALIDALRPDLLDGAKVEEQFGINWGSDVRPHGERIIRYQGFAANGNEATNPIDIRCIPLPATLTDTPDLPNHQRAVLNFEIPSGLLDGAYEEGGELDLYAEFAANYIVRRDPEGRWCEWNGSAYVNPLAGIVGGAVYDIKEAPNGDIYVCGKFTSAGGVANTKCIARWSKANQVWQAVGNPVTGATITEVSCMAFDANGDLYVGGNFTNLAGIANADYIAKWNGSNWSALGTGTNATVKCLAINPDNGYLFIGGTFTLAGGVPNTIRIAYWNGASWVAMGAGLNSGVRALTFHANGNLYVGGGFTDSDSTNGDYVCIWNGTSFKALGGTELDNEVMSLKFDNHNNLYAGGIFGAAGSPAENIAVYKNGGWVGLTSIGANSTVSAIEIASNNDIYVGGIFTTIGGLISTDRIAVYRNGAWSQIDINLPGSSGIYSILKASDGSLYLGGEFSTTASGENAISSNTAIDLNVSSGSANTYPFISVMGPGKLNSIINYTTGAHIEFNDLTLQEGEWIGLNFDPVNLKFRGGWAGRGNLLRYVNPGSDYGNFYLKPGNNLISVFMDKATTTAATNAWITWKPKFWGIDGALLE